MKVNKIFLIGILFLGCTHKIQIEPSDKPFVVNFNVQINHEIRMRIEDKNKDLLALEDTAVPTKKGKK